MGRFYFLGNWTWGVENGLVVLYVRLLYCIVDFLACFCVEWVGALYFGGERIGFGGFRVA